MALKRNGMERLWRGNKVLSLHELCCHAIVASTSNVYAIDRLPLPDAVKANLKSYASLASHHPAVNRGASQAYHRTLKERKKKAATARLPAPPPDAVSTKCASVSRKSCVIS
jgi:Ras-related protein Rab-40